jgi:hypothetical protein
VDTDLALVQGVSILADFVVDRQRNPKEQWQQSKFPSSVGNNPSWYFAAWVDTASDLNLYYPGYTLFKGREKENFGDYITNGIDADEQESSYVRK